MTSPWWKKLKSTDETIYVSSNPEFQSSTCNKKP